MWYILEMGASTKKHKKLTDYIEDLLERGEITFTKKDALKTLSITEIAFDRSSLRLIKKRHLVKPLSGFYVIVSPENRSTGGPEPILYIKKLMKYVEQPYYIGLLSAALQHGATHQPVMELQVVTTKPIKTIRMGRHRIIFIVNRHTNEIPTTEIKTRQGMILISTIEATAFDLVRFHKKSGGLSHVATVFLEIGRKINSENLAKIAAIYNDTPLAQRVGFLLSKYGAVKSISRFHAWLKTKDCSFKRLSGNRKGRELERNKKWFIITDVEVEPDEV